LLAISISSRVGCVMMFTWRAIACDVKQETTQTQSSSADRTGDWSTN
jgi:hypothetical protein